MHEASAVLVRLAPFFKDNHEMTNSNQQKHFENIHDRYQYHYYDKYSNYYRKKVILDKIKIFF